MRVLYGILPNEIKFTAFGNRNTSHRSNMQDSLRETLRQQNSREACAEMQKAISTGKVKLKSDLKKSSALVKKLKVLGDSNLQACLKDVSELNLTRYLSECVVSLVEAAGALKPSEVSSHVHLISALHQRYGVTDITEPLVQSYCAAAFAPPAVAPPGTPVDVAAKQRQLKRRLVTLRILTELFFVGVLTDASVIHNILHTVVTREELHAKPSKKQSSSQSSKQPPLDVPLLVSFAKYAGPDFLGTVSTESTSADGGSRGLCGASITVPAVIQAQLRALFDQAFDMIATMYVNQHQTVRKLEKRNMKEEVNRGELSEEHVADLAAATLLCEKLTGSITTLSEALQRPMPALPVDNSDDARLAQLLLWDGGEGRAELHADGPFDDEDTRSFYEDLPDLLELVPAVVLGLTETEVAELKMKKEASSAEAEAEAAAAAAHDDDGAIDDLAPPLVGDDADSGAADSEAPAAPNDTVLDTDDDKATASAAQTTSYHHQMDAFFASLEDMVNRDRCDKAAVDFCYRNTKAARTRLVNTLYSVPRTHLELLPYYSRLLAALARVLKEDVGGALVDLLVHEFNYFQKKKNQYRLESKVKNIRFLAELTKFKVAPPMVGFRCLRRCFSDFQGHNVVIATTFLETCGRFLYCSKYTHVRTAQCLDIMMRLKAAKHLDPLADTLVQNAFYMCKPPEVVARVKAPRDPIYLFMLHLLYSELTPESVGKVVRICRKFDWDHADTTRWFIKAVLKVTTAQVLHMAAVCDVVAGLSRYHEELSVYIVDTVIEAIQLHLTLNHYKYHQRNLGLVKLLGELYNHQLVTSVVVFDILYGFLNHSHDMAAATLPDEFVRRMALVPDMKFDPRVPSDVDSDRNVFRVRLICALLETCGASFDRGITKRKLDRFLVFFQRYLLAKADVPLETEFVVLDTFDLLSTKDKVARYDSWEQVDAAAHAIWAVELQQAEKRVAKAKAASIPGSSAASTTVLPIPEEYDDDDDAGDNDDDDNSSSDDNERAGGGATSSEDEDEEDDEDEDEDDDEDDEDDVEEEEHIIVKHDAKIEEDDEFDKAFKAMMQSSVESRKHIPRVNADKMAIPTVVKTTHHVADEPTAASMVFRVLKRGNKGKLEAREILVPQATSLAQHSQRQEDAGKKEQSELKRLVLLNVERDEMNYEDEDGALSPPPTSASLQSNHTSRHYIKPTRHREPNNTSSYIVANPTGRGATWGTLESFLEMKKTSIVGVGPQAATRGGRAGGRGYRSGR
ncbi:hypothetical protein, variant 1 [Aphanomyces invadans]|uniref:MIF4G domain-containing protein n=1 Tax=Aphanomyces invadans TaxID=157072 RepID=A0A024TGB5_9STRA|nr:hypothetical protein, variant 1 [Aphanomyces invadans]ETV92636.1 hypothetical protein, variant 1 [Aphanomyces invadans]|eukprot:XP_008878671.1 hypothetical protein, variant 1 [Aphanomyces invadans]